jgi:hypothetical protein
MPLDYTAIQQQLHTMGSQVKSRLDEETHKAAKATTWLDSLVGQNEQSRERIMAAAAANSNLRSAIPTYEEITGTFLPPAITKAYTILAADGSQVNPSRHDPIPFSVINIGVFCMDSTMQSPPHEIVETQLLPLDEIYNEFGLVGEEVIALRRDLRERQMLSKLANEFNGIVLTLTDGPLELFRDPQGSKDTQKEFEEYLGVLRQLAKQGTITAGYVDRPGSDLVVRMLEVLSMKDETIANAGKSRPLAPLSDVFLFQDRIPPGARSAVFGIQSRSAQSFPDETSLHFFYLNIGLPEKPSLARVEIPAWVAGNKDMVGLLHAVLVDQSRILGTTPYPYALHRSHEIALVSFSDKAQIETMIGRELVSQGLTPPAPSNKQFAKNLKGRMRNR